MSNPQKMTKLHHGYLSVIEVLAYAIGMMGTSGVVVIVVPLVFANAGNGTWLTFLAAMVAYLFVARQMNVFGASVASPGSLSVYVRKGIGPLSGALTGWALFLGYVCFIPVNLVAIPYYLLMALHQLRGPSFETSPAALIVGSILVTLVAWMLAYRDIRLSSRATMIIEFVTIGLIVILIGGYFGHHDVALDRAQVHLEGVSLNGFALGLVLAMAGFTGFDAAAALGEEAHALYITIPKVIRATVYIAALVVVVAAFTLTQAFHGLTTPLDKDPSPINTLGKMSGLGGIGPLIFAGVGLSWFACVLGCFNTASRILFSFAQHGLVPGMFGRAHQKFQTPHRGISVLAVIGSVTTITLIAKGFSVDDIITDLATMGGFGFLIAYIMVCIAALIYSQRQHKLSFSVVGSSMLGVVLMLIPLVGSVFPVPAYPLNILPFIFLGFLGLCMGTFLFTRKGDLAPRVPPGLD